MTKLYNQDGQVGMTIDQNITLWKHRWVISPDRWSSELNRMQEHGKPQTTSSPEHMIGVGDRGSRWRWTRMSGVTGSWGKWLDQETGGPLHAHIVQLGECPRARVWASCINLKKIQRAEIQTDRRMREALGVQARHKVAQCEIWKRERLEMQMQAEGEVLPYAWPVGADCVEGEALNKERLNSSIQCGKLQSGFSPTTTSNNKIYRWPHRKTVYGVIGSCAPC